MPEHVVVFKHKGYEITVIQNAEPEQIGYYINDHHFTGRKYNLLQDAVDDIDDSVV